MGMRLLIPSLIACKSHDYDSSHIEGRYGCPQKRCPTEGDTFDSAHIEGDLNDLVLRIETCKRRYPDDCQVTQTEGCKGDRHVLSESAIPSHVHFIIHTVHDRSGSKEHSGFEEPVRQQVHDGEGVTNWSKSCAQNHVADL